MIAGGKSSGSVAAAVNESDQDEGDVKVGDDLSGSLDAEPPA